LDLGLVTSLKQQSFELIIKYCKNIKFLYFHGLENQIIHLVINLIENTKQNLNYLSINTKSYYHIANSSIILQNLGKILPSNLDYLNLTLSIKASDFEIFLKNSQNTFIKKLVINNKDCEDILPCIKEHIMKNKRVKYLAILNSFPYNTTKNNDLFDLKNEVEEFKLYNIGVQYYYDLSINNYKYIDELD